MTFLIKNPEIKDNHSRNNNSEHNHFMKIHKIFSINKTIKKYRDSHFHFHQKIKKKENIIILAFIKDEKYQLIIRIQKNHHFFDK